MTDTSGPKWSFFSLAVIALLVIAAGVGGYFLGKKGTKPVQLTQAQIIRDTARIFIPMTRYVERIKRDTTNFWILPSAEVAQREAEYEAHLDSMQALLDQERRIYLAADTTMLHEVVVLDMTGKPIARRTFMDPLGLLCYPQAAYISVQRGQQPWEIQLPVPLAHEDTWWETIWSRFKTGTAYAFIGGTVLYILLLAKGAI